MWYLSDFYDIYTFHHFGDPWCILINNLFSIDTPHLKCFFPDEMWKLLNLTKKLYFYYLTQINSYISPVCITPTDFLSLETYIEISCRRFFPLTPSTKNAVLWEIFTKLGKKFNSSTMCFISKSNVIFKRFLLYLQNPSFWKPLVNFDEESFFHWHTSP